MASYKIKDLEQLTGIKAHTIRIWEKRYGILKPSRTDTQIRSYTDDELKLLLNVSILNNQGVKISKIADLSEKEIFEKVDFSNFDKNTIHEHLLLSLIELNENLFNDTINQLINEKGIELTYIEHIFPFLEKIGVMWLVGTINPAQEHFISNLIRQKVIVEIDKIPCNSSGKKVILFLPEHETHELSLLFYSYVLKSNGFQTYYLGQCLPFDSLIESIKIVEPDFLVTSWIVSVDEKMILDYFNQIKELTNVPVYAGGFQIITNEKKLNKCLNIINNLNFYEQ
jgi:MerR family transcriptional regulator, light-induced transcriptional regulator